MKSLLLVIGLAGGREGLDMDENYQNQIDMFYRNKLPTSSEIKLGNTPEVLLKFGAKELPLIIKQSSLRKCIREPKGSRSAHQIDRAIVEKLPALIKNPIIVVEEKERNSQALICDCKDKNGHNILIAIQMEQKLYGNMVNEVKSIYGKEHLTEYLRKFSENEIHVVSKEKVKQLSPTIGLQLSEAPITLDYNNNVPQKKSYVNENTENTLRKSCDIVKEIRKSGYQATKSLVRNIKKLDALNGKNNTLRGICDTYKNNCLKQSKEEKDIIQEIAKECKEQELSRMHVLEK